MKDSIPKHFQCGCCCSVIQVVRFGDDPCTYVSVFNRRKGKVRWWHRLEHIWHILRYGDPYDDNIILLPEETKRLAEALLSPIEQTT